MSADQKKRGRPSRADIEARAAAEARAAGPNRAEQGNEAAAEPTALADMIAPAVLAADCTLAEYIASLECARTDAVLTLVEHPDATVGIHDGRFSGIRTAPGALRAVWSDGQVSKPDPGRQSGAVSQDQPA